MSVLVYIGTNECWTINQMCPYFDEVHAFDPLPRGKPYLEEMKKRHSNFHFYEVAASDSYGTKSFYVTGGSGCSSSLLKPNQETNYDEIQVETVDISNFLEEKIKIQTIDFYVSDAQGHDFTILKNLKHFIDQKRIGHIKVETYGDNLDKLPNGQPYKNSTVNCYSNFEKLLEKNYNLIRVEDDSRVVTERELDLIKTKSDENTLQEFDCTWGVNNL